MRALVPLVVPVAACAVVLVLLCGASDAQSSPTAQTTKGNVTGLRMGNVNVFLGVPYAKAPTGSRRWRAPEAMDAWSTPRTAQTYASACPQLADTSAGTVGSTNEDCLYLNVFAPVTLTSVLLPVLVYLPGGAFYAQIPPLNGQLLDGQRFAEQNNVVVVTVNYRVGPFGFLALQSLVDEGGAGVPGNYGLQDQQAALQWVKDNIAYFGGDASQVTLSGESAGATSICFHLVAPSSASLFARAIVQSSVCIDTYTRAQAISTGSDLAVSLYCSTSPAYNLGLTQAECMRQTSVSEILNSDMNQAYVLGTVWWPIVDGTLIPRQPSSAFASGNFNRKSTIFSFTADEGTIFFSASTSLSGAQATINEIFGSKASAVTAQYPTLSSSPGATLQRLYGDYSFACTALRSAASMAAYTSVYVLKFSAVPALSWTSYFRSTSPNTTNTDGSFHTADLVYVWQSPKLSGTANLQVASQMASMWKSFVQTGDPSVAGFTWPALASNAAGAPSSSSAALVGNSAAPYFATGLLADVRNASKCTFWDNMASAAVSVRSPHALVASLACALVAGMLVAMLA